MNNEYLILCKEDIIPFEIWQDIYNNVRKNKNNQTFGYGIKVDVKNYDFLLKLSKKIPLADYFLFLITNRRNREFPIHVDGIPGKNNAASINFPLFNCYSDSPTIWYESKNVEFNNINNSFFLKNTKNVSEIYRSAMLTEHNKPYLFRGDILHKGYCNLNTSQLRVITKWPLTYATWEEACKDFQNRNFI